MASIRLEQSIVTRHAVMDLLVPGAREGIPVRTVWQYDSRQPYAVQVSFLTGGEEIIWVFGRDLLRDSAQAPSGDGDVRAWTEAGLAGAALRLRLTSLDRTADLRMPRVVLDDFLELTYARVPHGSETEAWDLDEALRRLVA